MRIFDCTTFYNEKMIMDLRFNILNEFVDKFVVVESIYSHSGKKKKLNFDINDYPKFKDKINYIIIDHEPSDLFSDDEISKNYHYKRINSIKRINQSYDYMKEGILEASDNDLIILSDNDEIPNLSSISSFNNDFYIFEQLFFYYKFNYLYDRIKWYGSKACKKKKLTNFSSLRNLKNKKYPFWRIDTFFSNIKKMNLKIISNGGWHFTNLKTAEDIFDKFINFGHHDEFEISNLTISDIKKNIENGIVFYDHLADKKNQNKWNYNYQLKLIDEKKLPYYLIKNKDKYLYWFK